MIDKACELVKKEKTITLCGLQVQARLNEQQEMVDLIQEELDARKQAILKRLSR